MYFTLVLDSRLTHKQKGIKIPKLGVNLVESLIKGVMLADERMAPLNFLLSPKFLSSNQARVAAYAIAACVPYMKVRCKKGAQTLLANVLISRARCLRTQSSKFWQESVEKV